MKFYLNEKEIKVLNGATFSIQKDETLDSGKIELVLMEDKTPIKPMTDLTIIDDETYNFVVLSDTVEIASKKPECYKHTLQFVQNTKKFSKIQVRNTQFAQPAKNSLKCGCNATFKNKVGYETGYMQKLVLGAGEGNLKNEYSYSMEVSQRHKVKGAHFKIEAFWYKYQSQSQSGTEKHYQETMQDTCPELFIYFDVYKDDVFQYQKGAKYSNGAIEYLLSNLSNGVYTIKNIKVALLSDTSKYSEYDLFVVNISLVADVYYYSLYDVLDILRKQIALREGEFESIDAPTITYESEIDSSNVTNYRYVIRNNNAFECYCYVKTWQNSEEEPTSYKSVGLLSSYSSYTDSTLYKQTRLHIKAYLIKKDDAKLTSSITTGYKFMPPIVYEYKLYLSVFGKDATNKYKLEKEDEFQSDNDYQYPISCWQYIEDNYLYDLSPYSFNADISKVENDKFTLYGYCYYILKAPNIKVWSEYIASSGVYELKATFTNSGNSIKPVKICWWSEGTLKHEETYLEDGKEYTMNEGATVSIGTYGVGSSGKVYARCEYEELASDYASYVWSSSGVTAPDISFEKVYDNQYKIIIKQLAEPFESLYFRYKLGDDAEWSSWNVSTSYTYSFYQTNNTKTSKFLYVEAYSEVNGVKSQVTSAYQNILAVIVNKPKISYIIINDYTETITIENQATQSDAVIYYKVVKNGDDPIDYSLYEGSFQIQADEGNDDTFKILAYAYSKGYEGSSDVVEYKTTLYGTNRLVKPYVNFYYEYDETKGYSMWVYFTNRNRIATDIEWYSTGTFATSTQTILNVGAGEKTTKTLLGESAILSGEGKVFARTKNGSNVSDYAGSEWNYTGPTTYKVIVNYTGVGLSKTETHEYQSGTTITPSDYIKTFSGYKFNSISPSNPFDLYKTTTITINYLVGGKLDKPVFSEYSQDADDVTFKVTNTNSDAVTLYYVINPSEIPTSAEDIINATDHYIISNISTSAKDTFPWGGDYVIALYGVFVSTSHSTTYDDSDVGSITLYKRELSKPVITLNSKTSTSFTVNVYNPNFMSVAAVDLEGNIETISSRSSTTFTYSWSGATQTVTITLSKSGYTSATDSETFTRPIELKAPTYTEVSNTTEKLIFTINNPNSVDATYSGNSTVIAANQSMTITHIWTSSSDTYTASGYFYDGVNIRSDAGSYTFTKPSIPTIQLIAPTITYTKVSVASVDMWRVTIKNLNSIDVTCYISGVKSDTKSIDANSSTSFDIPYLSTTDRTVNAMVYRVDTETAKYISSSTTTITIPSNYDTSN